MKKILKFLGATWIIVGLAMGVVIVICIIINGYKCIHVDTHPIESQRFVNIDSDGLYGGALYVDTVTDIEYVVIYGNSVHGTTGVSMTPLLNEDGKPLKYDYETGK